MEYEFEIARLAETGKSVLASLLSKKIRKYQENFNFISGKIKKIEAQAKGGFLI